MVVLDREASLDERIVLLQSLDDAKGAVRLPYNLVVTGIQPHWLDAEAYEPGSYRGLSAAPSVSFVDAWRLPVVMDPHAFETKRSLLADADDVDVLSIAGGGLYLPGARSDRPHGVFSFREPARSVYGLKVGAAYLLPTKEGMATVRSANSEVPKPLRMILDDAFHEGNLRLESLYST